MTFEAAAVGDGARKILSGLEKWEWGTRDRVPEEFLQLVLINDENFISAQRRAVEAALAYACEHVEFQATISDMGSFFLCGIALYMDCTGGITHRRLREMTGESGIISAGRASAILWRLRLGKFVEAAPAKNNVKRFTPTLAMRTALKARLRVEYEALLVMEPNLKRLLDDFEGPRTLDLVIQQMGDDMLNAAGKPDPRLDDFSKIATRSGGVVVMYAIALACEDAPGSGGAVAPSVSSLARRFGFSRSHILRLLRLMEEAGFLETRQDERIVLPSLGASMRLFQAFFFAGVLRAAHRTLLTLAEPGGEAI